MAIKDITAQIGPKQAVEVTTVDQEKRKIEAKLKDGGIILVPVYTSPVLFRWPKVGEYWTVRKDGGDWSLGDPIDPVVQARSGDSPNEVAIALADLKDGEARIVATPNEGGAGLYLNNHQVPRKYAATVVGDGPVDHQLGTTDITVSVWVDGTQSNVDTEIIDENKISLSFVSDPTEARVVIVG